MIKIFGRLLKFIFKAVLFLFLIVVILAVFFGVIAFSEKALLPRDYYFYQLHPIAENAMIYLLVVPIVTCFGVMYGRFRGRGDESLKEMYELFFVWRLFYKGRLILVVLWLFCLYSCFASATVVTEEKIICHSPLHPSGTSYCYSDVTQIHAGFGQKQFALLEYQVKGNFYYQIELGGKKKTFSTPSVNGDIERYMDETYLELEDFDRRLVLLGIPKQASDEGWEACGLDSEYVERFRRIISY